MGRVLPIVRTSERRDFLRCQERWYWSWREGLRPYGPPSVPLWFGAITHEALAAYYIPGTRRGPHPAETFERLAGREEMLMKISEQQGNGEHSITEETLVDAKALGITMLNGYVAHWEKEDERWEIIRPEQTFQMRVPHPSKPDKFIAISAGTYDLVKRHLGTGEFWLGEHKTCKAIITDHLALDPQAGSYWLVATAHLQASGIMKRHQRLRGIEYNFLRTALPDTRPRTSNGYCTNKPTKAHYGEALGYQGDEPEFKKMTLADLERLCAGYGKIVLGDVSKNQPRPLFHRENVPRSTTERRSQLRRLQIEVAQMEPLRAPGALRTKNATRDCQWDCPHYGMCLLDEQGGDVRAYREAVYQVQDPYADHRKDTEGND